ncbi:MAG: uroporphyrinogen-III C-methyltransferase [Gemmatimonas sp.]
MTSQVPDAFPDLPEFEPGTVWLTGAGPGDPGLLTLLALYALRTADVIVYDALVDARIMALANPTARRIHAGKRGGRPSPSQADISRTLVDEARKNVRVLRLKGGDPFVFGRGGEEALALAAADIPFRLVPGITAGIGGLAYAGIPATHRDVNSAVAFITGHAAGGDVPGDVDWEALGRGAPVLVIYMALKHLGTIAQRLMDAGRPGNEPVAVVSRATTPSQVIVETTLARAAQDAEAQAVKPPAIVVVGQAVRLRSGLDWIGALAGRVLDPDPLREK